MEGTDCVQSYPILPNGEPTTTARCYCSRGMVNHFPLNTQNHSFTHTPTPTPVAFLSFFTRGGRRAVDGFKGDDEWWQMWLARISALSGVQWWYVVFFHVCPLLQYAKDLPHTHTGSTQWSVLHYLWRFLVHLCRRFVPTHIWPAQLPQRWHQEFKLDYNLFTVRLVCPEGKLCSLHVCMLVYLFELNQTGIGFAQEASG